MISSEQIQKAVERLDAAANPSKVILFGSCACGEATEDSDLDLIQATVAGQVWRDGIFAAGITAIAHTGGHAGLFSELCERVGAPSTISA